MSTHPKARLGLAGRQTLVEMIERGASIRSAARAFNVAPATAHKWWHRPPLGRGAPRPLEPPTPLPADARRGRPGADLRGPPPHRLGTEADRRRRRPAAFDRPRHPSPPRDLAGTEARREQVVRYEWPCPGDLLHIDTKRYSRFQRPGHAATGDRSERNRQVGYEWAHSAVDDHSRLAHSELHRDERAETVVGFLERVRGDYRRRGIRVRRLMTANHFSYTRSTALRELLARKGIRHITTQPYRPQTNGKVERFQQTMAREWGYGLAYASSGARAKALPHWLRYYNERRPHSAIGDRPPLSRVHDLSGQDTGEPALLVNTSIASYLETEDGCRLKNSEQVLADATAAVADPSLQCSIRWCPGSVVAWDNRATLHRVATDFGSARRVMERLSIAGPAPATMSR